MLIARRLKRCVFLKILIRLLPYDKNELLHVLLPLVAGQVLLPRLKLTSSSYAQEILDRFAQRNVPISMFILVSGEIFRFFKSFLRKFYGKVVLPFLAVRQNETSRYKSRTIARRRCSRNFVLTKIFNNIYVGFVCESGNFCFHVILVKIFFNKKYRTSFIHPNTRRESFRFETC